MAASWPLPQDTTSTVGLGGGLAWTQDADLCAALLDRFDAETFDYFGHRFLSFVSCEEITDALLRGFSTWSANHARISFFAATAECDARNHSARDCALAEVVLQGSGAVAPGGPLEVDVNTTDGSNITRVSLTFDTAHTCYFMDATVCETIRWLSTHVRMPPLLGELGLAVDEVGFALIVARACS